MADSSEVLLRERDPGKKPPIAVTTVSITRQILGGWESQHYVSTYRALLRSEMNGVLEHAGFIGARWLLPAESGFYQPIVLAKTPVGAP
jgi:hypothetical protein